MENLKIENLEPKETLDSEGAKRILEAAKTLFSVHGYDGVPISAIAKEAGVSQANIIYHFKSKKGLYCEVLSNANERVTRFLEELHDEYDNLPEFLLNFSGAHMDKLMQDETASNLLLREILGFGLLNSEELANLFFKGSRASLFVKLLEAQRSGFIRNDIDPIVAAVLVLGANVIFMRTRDMLHHLKSIDFDTNPQNYSKKVMAIFLGGVLNQQKK